MCVTETWFKTYMSMESVGLAAFSCERKERVDEGGGGVAYYVAETIEYDRLYDIENAKYKVILIKKKSLLVL